MSGANSGALPALHLPDEPVGHRAHWRRLVDDGADWGKVVDGEDGPAAWLWARWQVLGRTGMDHDLFSAAVVEYRRELWYWLLGERTWAQACSGLIGRLERRLAHGSAGPGSAR